MKIECTIDGRGISGNFHSCMPLSFLLRDQFADGNIRVHECDDKTCLHCLVMAESDKSETRNLYLSCITPVFRINGWKIYTKQAFLKTENARDIIDAYKMLKIHPCDRCYEEKTMIFSYIIDNLARFDSDRSIGGTLDEGADYIVQSGMNMSSCKCLLGSDVWKIINAAKKIRRNRLV